MLEELILFAFSALLGLGCFGAMSWIVLSPETLDVDKIFSIIACLVMGLIFFGLSGWMLRHTRLRELWRRQPAAVPESDQKATSGGTPETAKAGAGAEEPVTEAAAKRAS